MRIYIYIYIVVYTDRALMAAAPKRSSAGQQSKHGEYVENLHDWANWPVEGDEWFSKQIHANGQCVVTFQGAHDSGGQS